MFLLDVYIQIVFVRWSICYLFLFS